MINYFRLSNIYIIIEATVSEGMIYILLLDKFVNTLPTWHVIYLCKVI